MSKYEGVLDDFLATSANAPVLELGGVPRGGDTKGKGEETLADLNRKITSMTFKDGTDDDKVLMRYNPKEEDAWDCETILSTRTTLYNHPTRIVEPGRKIKIDPKTGALMTGEESWKDRRAQAAARAAARANGELVEGDEDADSADGEEDEGEEAINTGVKRDKEESLMDKKARKQAIKDERRMRRQEKKATKSAFKSETEKQKDMMQSNPRHGLKVKQLD